MGSIIHVSVSPKVSRQSQLILALICLAVAPTSLAGEQPADGQSEAVLVEAEPKKGMVLITGSVVDEEGKPIAGAHVWRMYGFSKLTGKSKVASTRSDAKGRFRLELPAAEITTHNSVWALAPAHTLQGEHVNKDGETVITLPPSEELTFAVVDPDGKPVIDALVEPVNYLTSLGYDLVPQELADQIRKKTDDRGVVRFNSMALDKLFLVRVTAGQYGAQTQQLQLKAGQPRRRTIELRRCVPVTGRLTAGILKRVKPEWLSGVRISLQTMPPARGKGFPPFPTQGYAVAVTNEQGEFSVPSLAEGNLQIHVSFDESLRFRPQLPRFVQVEAATDLEIPLLELVEVVGSVITSDGDPLEGVKLHVYYGQHWQGTDIFTDAEGKFVAWVLPGKVRFQPQNLARTNYLQFGQPKPFDVPEGDGSFEFPAIELVKAKPASGKLISQETRKHLAGAEVIAYFDNWLCSTSTTDEKGRFELKKIPELVDADELTYRIKFGTEDLRHMRTGDVKIDSSSPLVVSVKEKIDR